MKKSFKVLFSLFMFLMVVSFTQVEAKDVIINIGPDGSDTNTIEGVNPDDLGTVEYQRNAYEWEYSAYGKGLKLLNPDDNYYIESTYANSYGITINNGVEARIKRLNSTCKITLVQNNIKELNANVSNAFYLSSTVTVNNANVVANSLEIWGYSGSILAISNSSLEANGGSIDYTSDSMTLSNSKIKIPGFNASLRSMSNSEIDAEWGSISLEENVVDNSKLVGEEIDLYDVKGFEDSVVDVAYMEAGSNDEATISNSRITTKYLYFDDAKLIVDNSYIKLGANDVNLNQDSKVKELVLRNSYFEAETDHDSDTSIPFYAIGTDLSQYAAYDESGNTLVPSVADSKYLFNDSANIASKHIFIVSPVKITFKVKNGTWADGTTDDIVVNSYYYGSLSQSSVPTGMKANAGYRDGSWDKDIVYDELTGDYVYTYVFGEGVGETSVISNPNTGEHTLIYTVLLLVSTCGIIGVRRYKKRLG